MADMSNPGGQTSQGGPGFRFRQSSYPPPGFPMFGGPVPPLTPKRRVGLIVAIVVGLSLMLAILCALSVYIFLLARATVSGPTDAVDAWLTAARDGNVTELKAQTCQKYAGESIDNTEVRQVFGSSLTWRITSVTTVNGDADVQATLRATSGGQTESTEVTFEVIKEKGDWKVCGLTEHA